MSKGRPTSGRPFSVALLALLLVALRKIGERLGYRITRQWRSSDMHRKHPVERRWLRVAEWRQHGKRHDQEEDQHEQDARDRIDFRIEHAPALFAVVVHAGVTAGRGRPFLFLTWPEPCFAPPVHGSGDLGTVLLRTAMKGRVLVFVSTVGVLAGCAIASAQASGSSGSSGGSSSGGASPGSSGTGSGIAGSRSSSGAGARSPGRPSTAQPSSPSTSRTSPGRLQPGAPETSTFNSPSGTTGTTGTTGTGGAAAGGIRTGKTGQTAPGTPPSDQSEPGQAGTRNELHPLLRDRPPATDSPTQEQFLGSGGRTTQGGSVPGGSLVALTEEERKKIRDIILAESVAQEPRAAFDLRVGAKVPESVSLNPMPPKVLQIEPRYKEFGFVIVEDRIVVVQRSTREIDTMIPI